MSFDVELWQIFGCNKIFCAAASKLCDTSRGVLSSIAHTAASSQCRTLQSALMKLCMVTSAVIEEKWAVVVLSEGQHLEV